MPTVPVTSSPSSGDIPGDISVPAAPTASAVPLFSVPQPRQPQRGALPAGLVLDNALPTGLVLDAGPTLDTNPPPANPPANFKPTVEESFLHSTSVGRILDAFGEGLSDGYGTSALGFSPESEQVMRDVGVFQGAGDNIITGSLRAFNEALIRPAATALDAIFRSVPAATHGIARGVGQTAQELGADQGMANRLTRDVVGLLDATMIVAGAAPVGRAGAVAERRAPFEPFEARTNPSAVPRPATVAPAQPRPAPGATNATAQPRPTTAQPRPATAAPERAGNINLDRINGPEDVKQVIREAAEANGGFDTARRGTIALEETESMAGALGMSEQQLLRRNIGQSFNAEEILAARTLLVDSATRVRDLARLATDGTDAQRLAFAEAVTRHTAIQEQVAGLTAEAGRALGQFRIMAGETRDAKALSVLLDANQGRDAIAKQARLIAELDTPDKISKFILEARKATTSEMLLEFWINNLLSGPQTHVANIIGNTLTALISVPETAIAATIGKARSAFTGAAATERVLMGEAVGRLSGIVQGARDGVVAGYQAFRSEVVADATVKLEQTRRMAIPSFKVKLFGREFELGGKQARIPSRALMAEDEFFKSIGRRQEINAQAFRIADSENLIGTARVNRIAELVTSPTEAMRKSADAYARTITFQNPLGTAGNSLMALSNSHPLAKMVLPFVRTPLNILKFAAERTPLGLVSSEIRANLRGANGAIARDQELSRLAFGGMVMTATASLAAEGLITGAGPSDQAAMAVLRATGWQPNSIKIGDTYYSYARFEPMALLLGVTADAYELSQYMTAEERERIGGGLFAAIARNLTSKTWLRGPADLIQALTDPDRYAEPYLRKLAGTAVPTGVAQIARTVDPVLRETRTILDQIRSRVPGLSKDLLPRRDIFGQPIVLEGSFGPDIASTIYMSRERDDPVARELLALGVYPSRIDRKVEGIELTPAEYDRLQVDAGIGLHSGLAAVVTAPGWADLPEFVRKEVVEKIVATSRAQARKVTAMQPDFLKRKLEARQAELQAKLGGE